MVKKSKTIVEKAKTQVNRDQGTIQIYTPNEEENGGDGETDSIEQLKKKAEKAVVMPFQSVDLLSRQQSRHESLRKYRALTKAGVKFDFNGEEIKETNEEL